jgi:hypothetical protein
MTEIGLTHYITLKSPRVTQGTIRPGQSRFSELAQLRPEASAVILCRK